VFRLLLKTVIAAQTQSQRMIYFLIEKTKLYDKIQGRINERQRRALDRIFHEGPDGFKGGLSAANYISITGAKRATATRDLSDLVDQDVFIQTGELESTHY
jgi:Fic family protein